MGWKHGLRAQVVTLLAPAIPGKFLECNGCEYFEQCKSEKWRYCPVNLEPILQFLKAFQEGKVTDLKDLAAFSQGHAFSVLRMMFNEIYQKGVLSPKMIKEARDENGNKTKYIEWQSNPLLRRIPEFMQLLGFTAEQQMMTPKSEREDENMQGFLKAEESKTSTIQEFTAKQEKALFDLKEQIRKAAMMRASDEALKRHQQELEYEESDDSDREQG